MKLYNLNYQLVVSSKKHFYLVHGALPTKAITFKSVTQNIITFIPCNLSVLWHKHFKMYTAIPSYTTNCNLHFEAFAPVPKRIVNCPLNFLNGITISMSL